MLRCRRVVWYGTPGMSSSHTPSASEPQHPAGYGKACVACVRGKTKCVFRDGTPVCVRCEHLGRDCRQPSPNSARKTIKRKASDHGNDAESSTRIARLEEKLDGLVSILSSGIKSGAVAMATDTGDAISQHMRTEDSLIINGTRIPRVPGHDPVETSSLQTQGTIYASTPFINHLILFRS